LFREKNKTFRPKKKIPKESKQYEMHKHAKATLGSGNLKAAVQLPPKEDVDEWLAVNSFVIFFV
jgi:MOB kinase activator 1